MLATIAVVNENKRKGTTKLNAKHNFEKNVEIVASHISLWLFLRADSSDMCIPNASEKASDIAISKIPAITIAVE